MIVVIEVSFRDGDFIPPVGIHADTLEDALKEYENWYPGILNDPSYGIGEIKIKCVTSISHRSE